MSGRLSADDSISGELLWRGLQQNYNINITLTESNGSCL